MFDIIIYAAGFFFGIGVIAGTYIGVTTSNKELNGISKELFGFDPKLSEKEVK